MPPLEIKARKVSRVWMALLDLLGTLEPQGPLETKETLVDLALMVDQALLASKVKKEKWDWHFMDQRANLVCPESLVLRVKLLVLKILEKLLVHLV